MKRNLAMAIFFIIAAVQFAASISLVPEGNRLFQEWFDTGYQLTASESNHLLLARVLSFPLAFWVWLYNPANISPFFWYASVIANAILWGVLILWAVKFLNSCLGIRNRK
jgi:hypothetical protein